jgi:hypothetical protein
MTLFRLAAEVKMYEWPEVAQFAQKHSPCHSDASFIGEESASCQQRNLRFLARQSRASEGQSFGDF